MRTCMMPGVSLPASGCLTLRTGRLTLRTGRLIWEKQYQDGCMQLPMERALFDDPVTYLLRQVKVEAGIEMALEVVKVAVKAVVK